MQGTLACARNSGLNEIAREKIEERFPNIAHIVLRTNTNDAIRLAEQDKRRRTTRELGVADNCAEIVAACGETPKVCIVRDSQITAGLDLLCERDVAEGGRVSPLPNDALPRLGDILVERGDISPEALHLALADYSPQRDGLIGAYLAARDVVFNQAIEDALAEQRRRIERLRENRKLSPLQPVAGKAI